MQLENPPRKPFIARGSNIDRCERCFLHRAGCICAHRREVAARVQFCLLSHPYELYKPTNTGRLIADTIQGTRVFHWHRTEPDPEFLALINDPGIDPYIVFPPGEDYQQRMTEYSPKQDRQSLFIILDGTWRQARRIFRLSDYLQHLPVISLTQSRESRYNLRKTDSPGQLCTVEVAAALLEQIGDADAAKQLDDYFDLFNDNYKVVRRF